MAEDRPSRIAFLRDRLAAASRSKHPSTFDVPFRGRKITCPQIRIRTDFPLYRIQSGRTHRAQAQYLDRHSELPSDFFRDPEDPSVQAAQHTILLELITERGLDKDLAERGQWSPMVLTCDGFVVDGNRRLCALREERIEYVQAVILPEDAERSEIYETEVELQMAAETKAPYNWIDAALHIRYGIEQLEERPESVAERMRMDATAVKEAIAQLSVVDMYLEWLGKPGKYHLIPTERGGSAEQAFDDLTQALSRQTTRRLSREQQRAIRESCFSAILTGGGYNDVRRIEKYLRTRPRDLLDRVAETLPDDIASEAPESVPHKPEEAQTEGDLLTQLVQSEPVTTNTAVTEILSIVCESDKALRAGPSFIRAAEDLAAEEKEAQRLAQPLQRIQKALKELSAVELRPETQGLDEVASTLAQIIEQTDRLVTEINKLRSQHG